MNNIKVSMPNRPTLLPRFTHRERPEQILARRIRTLCEARGMTVADLSRESGISYHRTRRILKGKLIYISELNKVAKALDADIVEMVREADER